MSFQTKTDIDRCNLSLEAVMFIGARGTVTHLVS